MLPRCRCTLRSPSSGNYCCLCFLKASAASWRLSPATLQCNVVVNAGLGWRLRKPNRPSKHTMTGIIKENVLELCDIYVTLYQQESDWNSLNHKSKYLLVPSPTKFFFIGSIILNENRPIDCRTKYWNSGHSVSSCSAVV